MNNKSQKLIKALKKKRQAEGLSIRALSSIIGISFSSLARMERGEGEPDNNSKLRILEWLGKEGRDSGLTFENVAFVHFRAGKNASSKTIEYLLLVADKLKQNYDMSHEFAFDKEEDLDSSLPKSSSIGLSKPEMEAMAANLRKDLGVKETEPFEALQFQIEGVEVYVPDDVTGIDKKCLQYLKGPGSDDWSAMSVPLDLTHDNWAIFRNDQHTPERQNVTYLEECWHILLGHKLTKIAKVSDSYGRTYDQDEEHDAFYLASATLLPEKAIQVAVKDKKTASETASSYGASPELVEYRIKRLGLWREYKGKEIKLSGKN